LNTRRADNLTRDGGPFPRAASSWSTPKGRGNPFHQLLEIEPMSSQVVPFPIVRQRSYITREFTCALNRHLPEILLGKFVSNHRRWLESIEVEQSLIDEDCSLIQELFSRSLREQKQLAALKQA
jgi:hypothetical protein